MEKSKLVAYINKRFGLADVKVLPQNVKKNSRPAGFARKYANGDPNSIIWLYHPQKRYVGMMVRKDLLAHKEIADWVNKRSKGASFVNDGSQYKLVMF